MSEEQESLGLTPEQQQQSKLVFGMLFAAIDATDTVSWEDSEIREIFGPFAINKEKTFVFQKEGDDWKRIMNILVDKNN